MKKTTILLAAILAVSAISIAFAGKNNAEVSKTNEVSLIKDSLVKNTEENKDVVAVTANSLMQNLQLDKLGLTSKAVELAVKDY